MLIKFIEKFQQLIKPIPDPPYSYEFLITLPQTEYPRYLKKIFFYVTNEKLNLKNPKTFNEKIQWLKLYDNSPLKTQLTDKVLVRNWIKEKIGENYLKPILWIGKTFNEIPFETLPNSFMIKANHGCKWHFKIKNKKEFLHTEELYQYIESKFDGWMRQTFFPWAGFELQYKDIKPQILIEELLIENDKSFPQEYEIYCFNGKPKIFQKIKYSLPVEYTVYDENFAISNICFKSEYINKVEEADEYLKKAVELSKILAENFKLVRIDWILYKQQIYFNEMTFTPLSGFIKFKEKYLNLHLGKMLKLK